MMEKRYIAGVLLVAAACFIFYIYRSVPMTEVCAQLKDAETISYIRLQLDKGGEEETQTVELEDQEIIETIAAQAEKVRLRYKCQSDGVSYEPKKGDHLIIVHVNSPDNQFIIKRDGSVYSENKQYVSKNAESENLYALLKEYF